MRSLPHKSDEVCDVNFGGLLVVGLSRSRLAPVWLLVRLVELSCPFSLRSKQSLNSHFGFDHDVVPLSSQLNSHLSCVADVNLTTLSERPRAVLAAVLLLFLFVCL